MSTFRRPLLRAPYLLTSPLRTLFAVHRTFSTASPLQSSVAKIQLIGRLAAEAELAATSDGTDMIRYSLATNSGTKENRKTSWWKIASFAGEGKGRDLLLSLGKGLVFFLLVVFVLERKKEEDSLFTILQFLLGSKGGAEGVGKLWLVKREFLLLTASCGGGGGDGLGQCCMWKETHK